MRKNILLKGYENSNLRIYFHIGDEKVRINGVDKKIYMPEGTYQIKYSHYFDSEIRSITINKSKRYAISFDKVKNRIIIFTIFFLIIYILLLSISSSIIYMYAVTNTLIPIYFELKEIFVWYNIKLHIKES